MTDLQKLQNENTRLKAEIYDLRTAARLNGQAFEVIRIRMAEILQEQDPSKTITDLMGDLDEFVTSQREKKSTSKAKAPKKKS